MATVHDNSRVVNDKAPLNGYHDGATASPHLRVIANPAPLGLFAFGATWYLLSMFNVFARGVSIPNVVLSLAIFYGGVAQILAGMWEFVTGNTFGATMFTTYGAFWLSYATFYIPSLGIASAYNGNDQMFGSALGIYYSCWFIISALFLVGSLRSTVGMIVMFSFLTLTFMLLMIDRFTGSVAVFKAAGAFGIITAFVAFYVGLSGLMTRDHGIFTLPVGPLNRRRV